MLLAALMIVWWLLAAASGPEYYAFANSVITSWLGDIIMALSVWALWYHFCAGLRHLFWDTGRGYEIKTAERLGITVIIGSFVLTAITLIAI